MRQSHFCQMGLLKILPLVICLAFLSVSTACSNGSCRLLDECSSDGDCESGLYCFSCPLGFLGSRCVRSTITNQFKLVNGVRALMLDTYDFDDDVWLCHSNGGKCHDFTAFEPAIDTMKEIEAFLSANPSEIVTVILEDYVKAPNGLTKVFNDSGLLKYWFPVSRMPQNGQDWPLVSDMVASNQRLIVFTSVKSKQELEGIAYQWNFMVENQYGDDGMKAGSCFNRAESSPLNETSKSLVLVNYFRSIPVKLTACVQNSADLIGMLNTCYHAAANRWANFVAVDYYKRSEGGGAFQATDMLNGRLLCGCDDVHTCVQPGSTSGACTPP
ncbi:PI-PLC X domain-containing protein At5g67130-like isoform X3 [Phoenix dactylifera]|uniref:PI-PLC X domain-containing protein At5g67130-like isoform X3 n=1 Tax=Phoenix dactylifera TaxID=42345 RepID=A0A8B8J0B4_PHODC|nr:PI-PLC X domain-containing protein At5g67130-like isoform X3 [Phoenix dactylifera]